VLTLIVARATSQPRQHDLLKRLADPKYAAGYLAQTLAEKDSEAFMIAHQEVVEAGGALANLPGASASNVRAFTKSFPSMAIPRSKHCRGF
jgi:DNA-binding phage protein